MVSRLLVGAMALTAQAEVWESDRTEALDVGTTPYEITVESGKTVKMSGTITGSAAITKNGPGTLLITSANGDFSGGFVIEKGYLTASNATALGSAAVTIVGQTAENSGDCCLGLWGAGTNNTAGITYANAVNVTGNTTREYPALLVYGHGAKLTGKVTAAHDFIFYDDLESTKAIHASYSDRCNYVTSLTFGEIEVGGLLFHDGWTKFIFGGKITAPVVSFEWLRPNKFGSGSNHMSSYEFLAASEIGVITNGFHDLVIKADNVFNGTAYIIHDSSQLVSARAAVLLNSHPQSFAILETQSPVASGTFEKMSDRMLNNNGSTKITVTVTGGGKLPEGLAEYRATCCEALCGNLNILIDAYAGFTQVFTNRINTMSGTIRVTNGALEIGKGSSFTKASGIVVDENGKLAINTEGVAAFSALTSITVNGRFSANASAFSSMSTALSTLTIGADAEFNFTDGGEIQVNYLTINGSGVPAGCYDSASFPQIKGGKILVLSDAPGFTPTPATWDGTAWNPSDANLNNGTVAATFTSSVAASSFESNLKLYGITFADGMSGYTVSGKGSIVIGSGGIKIADSSGTAHTYTFANKLEVVGNQDWIIAPNGKLVFDDAITNQAGKITVRGGKKSNIACDLVFKGTNILVGAMVVTGATVNVTGLLGTPGHVNQGTAEKNGEKTLSILGTDKGIASIYLNNGVIEKPVYLLYSGFSVLKSANNTTNAISGNMQSTSPWFGFEAGKTSEIAFEGGFTSGWTMRSTGTDASSVLRVRKTPINATASVGWNVHLGTLALDVAGNKFIYLTTAQNNGGSGCIDFGASYAFTDSNSMAFEPGFYFDNTSGQMHATSGNPKVYFHSTTQTVYTLAGGKRATIYADEGARLEVFKQTSPGTGQLPNARIYFASQIEGPLTIEMRGDGKLPLILSNQTFHSSGALIASKGVLDLAATATWLNGREFTAKGTGTLKFGANGQTDKMAVMNFADTGKVEIPSGVTVKVREAYVDGEQVPTGEYTKDSTTGGMTGRITGNGTLKVLSCGTTIMLW